MKKKDFQIREFKLEFGQEINHQCTYFSYDPEWKLQLNYLVTSESNEVILQIPRYYNTLSLSIDNSEPIHLISFAAEERFPSSYWDLHLNGRWHSYILSVDLIRRICEAKDIYFIFEASGSHYSTRKSKLYQPGYLIPYFQAFYDSFLINGSYPDCYKKLEQTTEYTSGYATYIYKHKTSNSIGWLLDKEKLLIALGILAFLSFILCDIFGLGNLFLVLEVFVAIATIILVPPLIMKHADISYSGAFAGALKAIFGTIGVLLAEAVLIDGIIGSVCNFGFVATFL